MTLLAVGLNHRTAPLDLREQLAIPPRDLPDALRDLLSSPAVDEAAILSTCNRIELYLAAADPSAASEDAVDLLSHRGRLAPERFQPHLYRFEGEEAVAHLFRVTAGLDSMILGESEIAAQVKQSYAAAHARGATGPALNRLFQKALHSAKIVRSRTRIAEGQASIGSVVVTLAQQLFGERLADCGALLWGAGKAAETTARHLMKHGVRKLWVVNRTQTKAQDLASLCQGGWLSWEQALSHLAHVDIAIVCTQAPHYVVDDADAERVLSGRGARPLCLIDLSVPRNVDPAIARRPGVSLYNIDHLEAIAREGLAQRAQELAQCQAIIREQAGYCWNGTRAMPHKEVEPCQAVGA